MSLNSYAILSFQFLSFKYSKTVVNRKLNITSTMNILRINCELKTHKFRNTKIEKMKLIFIN